MSVEHGESAIGGIATKWWVLLSVGIGTFMSALDGSIVNAILPVIQSDLRADVARIEWVLTIYLLVVSGLLLPFGRLGDLRGHKQVYCSGFVLFVASSALCGLARSAEALIAFRGIQALGAGMLFAGSPAILTANFPATQRGQALGMQATMTYLGLTAGPALGGWMTEHLGWRSVFYVNIPVGSLALACSLAFIPRTAPKERGEPFDVAGAAAFIAGLVALLLALNQGHAWGWGSPATLGVLGGAGLLLAAFVAIEWRSPHPMLDMSLFRVRIFRATVASALLNYMSVFSITFLMPFYLLRGRGLTPGQAGMLFTVQPAVMAVAAPISGTLSDRIGSRLLSTLGMGLLAAGLFTLSRLTVASPLWLAALGLGIAGLGTGIFIAPNNSALMGSAPRHRQGIAAGIMATARNVGMVLGIGLAGAILATFLTRGTPGALYDAVEAGFLVAGAIACVGCLTAAVRGR